jgi:hypothetical protein
MDGEVRAQFEAGAGPAQFPGPKYYVSIDPTFGSAGVQTEFTFTVTRDLDSQANIGYVSLAIPEGFTAVNVTGSRGYDWQGQTLNWNSQIAGNAIVLNANSARDTLQVAGATLYLYFAAVTPTTPGAYFFTPSGQENYDGSGKLGMCTSPPSDYEVLVYG